MVVLEADATKEFRLDKEECYTTKPDSSMRRVYNLTTCWHSKSTTLIITNYNYWIIHLEMVHVVIYFHRLTYCCLKGPAN